MRVLRGRWPSKKLSVLRIALDRKLRDVTGEEAIVREKVASVEWRNLDESTLSLKSIARMSLLARDKVRFTRGLPLEACAWNSFEIDNKS